MAIYRNICSSFQEHIFPSRWAMLIIESLNSTNRYKFFYLLFKFFFSLKENNPGEYIKL